MRNTVLLLFSSTFLLPNDFSLAGSILRGDVWRGPAFSGSASGVVVQVLPADKFYFSGSSVSAAGPSGPLSPDLLLFGYEPFPTLQFEWFTVAKLEVYFVSRSKDRSS
jgi:hypothetical protein